MEPSEHPTSGSGSDTWHGGLNRALLDSALDCIITMDATGRVLEFNAAAQRTFGYTREQAVGQELASLIIPPALRESHRKGLRHYLKTGEGPVLGHRLEIGAIRADGSEILVELAITALRVENQPVFTAYLRDITDRNKGEEASRRLAAIIESSDDAIISKDLNGRITSWNAAAEQLFGYTPEEIIGKHITTLIPVDRQHEEPVILERIRRGERLDHYETIRRRKDGTLLNISVTVSPLKDESGTVIGASKIARDITERIRHERRRNAQYGVANLLAGSLSLAEAGPRIIELIAAVGNWIAGSIWLEDKTESRLSCTTTWHQDRPELKAFAQASRDTILSAGSGLPGRVFTSQKPAWIRDVRHDEQFPARVGGGSGKSERRFCLSPSHRRTGARRARALHSRDG